MKRDFLKILEKWAAEMAIEASTFQNMGAPGMVNIARNFLSSLDLNQFSVRESIFEKRLNAETEKLRKKFPKGGQHWGSARKAMNIFCRNVFYNAILWDHYKLNKIEYYLEIPLNRYIAKRIRKDSKKSSHIPPWKGVIHLNPEMNKKYQEAAQDIAEKKYKMARVHLDVVYWRKGKGNPK